MSEGSAPISRTRERWPSVAAYDDSLFDLNHWMASPELKAMLIVPGGVLGQSSIYQTGGFACVAKGVIGDETWAVRLLYRQQSDLEERYRAIQARQNKGDLLDVMAQVEYREDEIGVSGFSDRFPVILVKWVEGLLLNQFVEKACNQGDIESLAKLRSALTSLESRMSELQISHGDLSGDNLAVQELNGSLILKLLDYDSIWLPEIRDLRSAVGDSEMQHPGVRLLGNSPVGPHADFVAFRIYDLGLQALIAQPALGVSSLSYERKFLVTRDEIMECKSLRASLMRKLDEKQFHNLVEILNSPFDELKNLEKRNVEDSALNTRQLEVEKNFWTINELVAALDCTVGELRKLSLRLGISSDDLNVGVSLDQGLTLFQLQSEVKAKRMPTDDGWIPLKDLSEILSLSIDSTVAIARKLNMALTATSRVSAEWAESIQLQINEERIRFPFTFESVAVELNMDERDMAWGLISFSELKADGVNILLRPYGNRMTSQTRHLLISGFLNIFEPETFSGSRTLLDISSSSSEPIEYVRAVAKFWSNDLQDETLTVPRLVESQIERTIQADVAGFPHRIDEVALRLGITEDEIHEILQRDGYLIRSGLSSFGHRMSDAAVDIVEWRSSQRFLRRQRRKKMKAQRRHQNQGCSVFLYVTFLVFVVLTSPIWVLLFMLLFI